MLKAAVVAAAAIFALSAGAASANIVIVQGSVPGNPSENVLLNSGSSGMTVLGTTNQTNTSVTFTGNEALSEPSNGQARIEATDGAYTFLNFMLTDPTKGFTSAEFNINAAATGTISITGVDQFGNVFIGSPFTVSANGQNFFNLTSTDGQIIKSVTIQGLQGSIASIADTRQIRLGGIGSLVGAVVPEPSTWGMLILGFGMVGAGLRLRRKDLLLAA